MMILFLNKTPFRKNYFLEIYKIKEPRKSGLFYALFLLENFASFLRQHRLEYVGRTEIGLLSLFWWQGWRVHV